MVLETVAVASSIFDRSMIIEPRALVLDVQKYALGVAMAVPDPAPYSEVSAPNKRAIRV